MKLGRKIISLLLVAVMMLTVCGSAMADQTVSNETNHSYDAYQIFKGTQADGTTDGKLAQVDWGTGVNGAALLTALQAEASFNGAFDSCTTAADVAAVMTNWGDKGDEAKKFANIADKHRTTEKTSIAAGATTVTLATGYYLLVDTQNVEGTSDAKNPALLQVTNKGSIAIEEKYTVPELNKSVKESTDDTYGEAADWNIGSHVPFRVTGTLPNNYADYDTYYYKFTDTLDANNTLKYDGNVKVYVDNGGAKSEITSGFTVTPATAPAQGGGTLQIEFADLKSATVDGGAVINENSTIVVEYTAELLSNAVIGKPGNKNEVYLEFSNNPNYDGNGKGKTRTDVVLVFTYELDNTKTDKNTDEVLPNAQFILLNSSKDKIAKIKDGKFVQWDELSKVTTTEDDAGNTLYGADYTLTSNEQGLFNLAGIEGGTYNLRETKAPDGYNKLTDDVEIVIAATLDKDEDTHEDTPALTALTITVGDKTTNGNLDNGTVPNEVENGSGSTLPETGGMGTTLLYVGGGILVLAAAILLVFKKRVSTEK